MIQQHIPNKNISVTKIPCSTKAFHNQSSMINAKKKKKKHATTKFFHTHTYKILPCSWNKNLHMSTNFPHTSRICSTKPTPQIFHNLNSPKSKPKFIQQHHIVPTLPKFMTHQHCSSYTMTKKYNNSKCSKAKTTTWSIIQCPKFQQEHTTKWQCPDIKFSMEHENNIFSKQRNKEKLTLKSILECGA